MKERMCAECMLYFYSMLMKSGHLAHVEHSVVTLCLHLIGRFRAETRKRLGKKKPWQSGAVGRPFDVGDCHVHVFECFSLLVPCLEHLFFRIRKNARNCVPKY